MLRTEWRPIFSPSNGLEACFTDPGLVEIGCYYQGQPVVEGDNFEDHVIKEAAGVDTIVGHIPDFFIALNGNNPPVIGIPHC